MKKRLVLFLRYVFLYLYLPFRVMKLAKDFLAIVWDMIHVTYIKPAVSYADFCDLLQAHISKSRGPITVRFAKAQPHKQAQACADDSGYSEKHTESHQLDNQHSCPKWRH